MKITLCGSIAFYDEMQSVRDILEKLGDEVKLPPSEISDENGKKSQSKNIMLCANQQTLHQDGSGTEKKRQ